MNTDKATEIVEQQGSLDGVFSFILPCCGAPLKGKISLAQFYRHRCCGETYEVRRATAAVSLYRKLSVA